MYTLTNLRKTSSRNVSVFFDRIRNWAPQDLINKMRNTNTSQSESNSAISTPKTNTIWVQYFLSNGSALVSTILWEGYREKSDTEILNAVSEIISINWYSELKLDIKDGRWPDKSDKIILLK